MMNFGGFLSDHAIRRSDSPALCMPAQRYTYGELDRAVNRMGNALRRLGVGPGAAVALYTGNCPEWVITFLALAKIGAVSVPLNFRLLGDELRHILTDSRSVAALVDGSRSELVAAVRPPTLQHVVRVDGTPAPGEVAYAAVEALGVETDCTTRVEALTPHSICYTSGTTGLPKGAVLTHANMVVGGMAMNVAEFRLTPADRFMIPGALCHRTGWSRLINAVGLGAPVFVLDTFAADRFWALLEQWRPTVIGLVPTMLRLLVQAAPGVAAASPAPAAGAATPGAAAAAVRKILLTGEALSPQVRAEAAGLFPAADLVSYLGTTETGLIATLRPEDPPAKWNSVGRPVPGVEVRLVDDAGQDVAPGEVGEIWVQSGAPGLYNIMLGYTGSAGGAAFRDGWFRTGDMGRRDDQGFLYLTDRKSDMILSGGLNIYSREVERTLEQHPAVLEAAVVGVPDPEWGEQVLACVVLRAGAQCSAEKLIAFCREHLASYKKPRRVVFLPVLPRNVSGKVLKRELRDQFTRDPGR